MKRMLESLASGEELEDGLLILRVRRRADLLTVESGPKAAPSLPGTLPRGTVHCWTLEWATHTERREKTGLHAPLEQLLAALTSEFAWVLAPSSDPFTNVGQSVP